MTMNATTFAPRNVARAEEVEVDHRRAHALLEHDEADEADHAPWPSRADDLGRAPAPGVALDQRQHERGQADRQRRDAGAVDRAVHGLVARLARGEQRHGHGAGGHGQVEEEDRAPGDVLGQRAAHDRPDRQRQGGDARPGADRLAALLGREGVGDDREGRRAS